MTQREVRQMARSMFGTKWLNRLQPNEIHLMADLLAIRCRETSKFNHAK